MSESEGQQRFDPNRNSQGASGGDSDHSRLADNSVVREVPSSQDSRLTSSGSSTPVFNNAPVMYTKSPNVDQSDHTEHASFIISDEYIPGMTLISFVFHYL